MMDKWQYQIKNDKFYNKNFSKKAWFQLERKKVMISRKNAILCIAYLSISYCLFFIAINKFNFTLFSRFANNV